MKRTKKSTNKAPAKFEFQGVSFDKHDIEHAVSCCRFLTGASFETLARWFECSLDDVEAVVDNSFQSLAWNLKIEPEFLLEAATEYSCQHPAA